MPSSDHCVLFAGPFLSFLKKKKSTSRGFRSRSHTYSLKKVKGDHAYVERGACALFLSTLDSIEPSVHLHAYSVWLGRKDTLQCCL